MSDLENHIPYPSGNNEINVLALVKGEERYVFLFKDEFKAEILRTLGRFASSPDLSFTWYDAAVLSQKVRQDSSAPKPKPKPEQPPAPGSLEDIHQQERASFESEQP